MKIKSKVESVDSVFFKLVDHENEGFIDLEKLRAIFEVLSVNIRDFNMVDIDLTRPVMVSTYFITATNELEKNVPHSIVSPQPHNSSTLQNQKPGSTTQKQVSFNIPALSSKPMLPTEVSNAALLAPITKYPFLTAGNL